MNRILANFPYLTRLQKETIVGYEDLLRNYNQHINLISRKDVDYIYQRHIMHSLSIAKVFSFSASSHIADVGSGGGFPGIPLAIVFPGVQFTLIDSIQKKTRVLGEIAVKLNLSNISVVNERVEKLNMKFDYVTGRAVTAFPDFYQLTRHLISMRSHNHKPNGIIYLKGGDIHNDLETLPKAQVFSVFDFFQEEFFATKSIIYLPVHI